MVKYTRIPDHIVIVIEENHGYVDLIGNPRLPYFNSLAQEGALFTNSFGVTHPSQPNYLAFFSGGLQGVTDNSCPHTFSTINLASELIRKNLTFGGYCQDLPYVGSLDCSNGYYQRKHNPWSNWDNIPSSVNMPFTSFNCYSDQTCANLPTISIVVPSQLYDMHDGSYEQADGWLRDNLDFYKNWTYTHNSLYIVTADEDLSYPENRIATIFIGPMVKQGMYNETINHYNLLSMLQTMYNLGNITNAEPISNDWQVDIPSTTPPSTTPPSSNPPSTMTPSTIIPQSTTPPSTTLPTITDSTNSPSTTPSTVSNSSTPTTNTPSPSIIPSASPILQSSFPSTTPTPTKSDSKLISISFILLILLILLTIF